VAKYTLEGARTRELTSENLSYTRQEFSRATSALFKLNIGVPELKDARIEESASSGAR
jgi:hypothetical protein